MSDLIVKNLNFGQEAQNKVFEGINKLTKAVSSTLGASGKCVLLEDGSGCTNGKNYQFRIIKMIIQILISIK